MLDVVVAPTYVKSTHSDQVAAGSLDLSDWGPGLALWARGLLTPDVAIDASLAFSAHSFDPADYETSSLATVKSYLTRLRFGAGYRIPVTQEMGVSGELTLGLGYRQTQQTMSQISVDSSPSAKIVTGWELYAQIQVPATERIHPWVRIGKTFRTKVTETPGLAGGDPQPSLFELSGGLRFKLTHTSEVFFGYTSEQISINYTGAGARTIPSVSTTGSSSSFALGYMYRL
jgi:hypothetical protein